MVKKDYLELASSIIEKVGGQDNIADCFHCVTRLRLKLKDSNLVDIEEIKKLDVMGARFTSDQLQIIIGNDVNEVYDAVCEVANIGAEKSIDSNSSANINKSLDTKKNFSFKSIGKRILSYISPVMIGILPVMIGAAMCKTIGVVLGPNVLNIISETSDLYVLFNILNEAFFYFLPIYLGYLAAKQLGTNILLGIFIGAMIIVPDFVAMVGTQDAFSVFGVPVPVVDYGASFLPVILGVWLMSYVYKFFVKVIPNAISAIFVPTITILVMAIVMFAVCAPLGTYIGQAAGNFFILLADANIIFRLIGCILLGVLFPYIVLGGMHMVLINFAIMTYLANGFESFVLPVSAAYSFAIYGVALGAMFKMKKKEDKAIALSFATTGVLAGISEPILYGIILKYKSAIKALFLACGIGAAYCGIFMPKVYVLSGLMNIFSAAPMWAGGGIANLVSGLIMIGVSFLAGISTSYFIIDFGEK